MLECLSNFYIEYFVLTFAKRLLWCLRTKVYIQTSIYFEVCNHSAFAFRSRSYVIHWQLSVPVRILDLHLRVSDDSIIV